MAVKIKWMPSFPGETWGVGVEELHVAACTFPGIDTAETEGENMDDTDSEYEGDNMPIDDELLDVVEEFALADEYHHHFNAEDAWPEPRSGAGHSLCVTV